MHYGHPMQRAHNAHEQHYQDHSQALVPANRQAQAQPASYTAMSMASMGYSANCNQLILLPPGTAFVPSPIMPTTLGQAHRPTTNLIAAPINHQLAPIGQQHYTINPALSRTHHHRPSQTSTEFKAQDNRRFTNPNYPARVTAKREDFSPPEEAAPVFHKPSDVSDVGSAAFDNYSATESSVDIASCQGSSSNGNSEGSDASTTSQASAQLPAKSGPLSKTPSPALASLPTPHYTGTISLSNIPPDVSVEGFTNDLSAAGILFYADEDSITQEQLATGSIEITLKSVDMCEKACKNGILVSGTFTTAHFIPQVRVFREGSRCRKLAEVLMTQIECRSRCNKLPVLQLTITGFLSSLERRIKMLHLQHPTAVQPNALREFLLHGSGAFHVMAESDIAISDLNDIDIMVTLVANGNTDQLFNSLRDSVRESIRDLLKTQHAPSVWKVNGQGRTPHDLVEHYFWKSHRHGRADGAGDQWSLVTLGTDTGMKLELLFVVRVDRQYQTSHDSFQIQLPIPQRPMETIFEITVKCHYPSFDRALSHIKTDLFTMVSPAQVRGGGFLKCCDLYTQGYKLAASPNLESTFKDLEPQMILDEMVHQFVKDFEDVQQQQREICKYLHNHYPRASPYDRRVFLDVIRSTVMSSSDFRMDGTNQRLPENECKKKEIYTILEAAEKVAHKTGDHAAKRPKSPPGGTEPDEKYILRTPFQPRKPTWGSPQRQFIEQQVSDRKLTPIWDLPGAPPALEWSPEEEKNSNVLPNTNTVMEPSHLIPKDYARRAPFVVQRQMRQKSHGAIPNQQYMYQTHPMRLPTPTLTNPSFSNLQTNTYHHTQELAHQRGGHTRGRGRLEVRRGPRNNQTLKRMPPRRSMDPSRLPMTRPIEDHPHRLPVVHRTNHRTNYHNSGNRRPRGTFSGRQPYNNRQQSHRFRYNGQSQSTSNRPGDNRFPRTPNMQYQDSQNMNNRNYHRGHAHQNGSHGRFQHPQHPHPVPGHQMVRSNSQRVQNRRPNQNAPRTRQRRTNSTDEHPAGQGQGQGSPGQGQGQQRSWSTNATPTFSSTSEHIQRPARAAPTGAALWNGEGRRSAAQPRTNGVTPPRATVTPPPFQPSAHHHQTHAAERAGIANAGASATTQRTVTSSAFESQQPPQPAPASKPRQDHQIASPHKRPDGHSSPSKADPQNSRWTSQSNTAYLAHGSPPSQRWSGSPQPSKRFSTGAGAQSGASVGTPATATARNTRHTAVPGPDRQQRDRRPLHPPPHPSHPTVQSTHNEHGSPQRGRFDTMQNSSHVASPPQSQSSSPARRSPGRRLPVNVNGAVSVASVAAADAQSPQRVGYGPPSHPTPPTDVNARSPSSARDRDERPMHRSSRPPPGIPSPNGSPLRRGQAARRPDGPAMHPPPPDGGPGRPARKLDVSWRQKPKNESHSHNATRPQT